MDYRKLISFGKGGYVISIPKDWVEENRLIKGSFITMERTNGSLVLLPKENMENQIQEISEKTIEIDGLPFNKIRRLLISAYLNAYDLVYLKGEELKEKLPMLKKQIHNLIAFEIIESTRNKLIIKDFLDFDTIELDKTFRKMDMVLRSIFSDIKLKDSTLFDNILERDNEVSRHYYLVLKATKKLLSKPNKKNNYRTSDLLNYWQVSVSLESISDELSRFVEILKLMKIDKKTEKEVFQIFDNVVDIYLKTMASFYKKDPDAAQALRFEKNQIFDGCNNLSDKCWDKKNIPIILEIFRNIIKNIQLILRRVYDK